MNFDRLWHQNDDFALAAPKPKLCPYAQQFLSGRNPAVEGCRGGEHRLGEPGQAVAAGPLHGLARGCPAAHRNLGGSRSSHMCIFQVFEETYQKLKTVELSLTPPMLFLPSPPPPPPPPPQIAGIFLGELEQG